MEQDFGTLPVHQFGPTTRFAIRLSGADIPTLAICPERDVDNVRAISFLMLAVWLYQSLLFSIIAHVIRGWDGQIHPELIGGAVLIASLIMLIDSYMIMRSTWHLHGINELKRAGLDISGGIGMRIKNALFLTLRSFLATVLALLMAIFLSLLVFLGDTQKEIDRAYQQANALIFAKQEKRIDGPIHDAANLAESSKERIAKLEEEEASIRQTLIDAPTDTASAREAGERLNRLEAEMAEATSALSSAVTFASDELAGIKAAKGNTGIKGDGPVRSAAEEKVQFATARRAEIGEKIKRAEAELAAARAESDGVTASKRQQTELRLGEVTRELEAERQLLAERSAEYQARMKRRDQDVREAVANDPSHVDVDDGFLARLAALKRLTSDVETLIVIALIHLGSLGIELAAVLAKVASFIPTTYAVKLASESYAASVEEANELARKIEPRKAAYKVEEDPLADNLPAPPPPPKDDEPPRSAPLAEASPEPIDLGSAPRKRGRPRKEPGTNIIPLNLAGRGKDQGNGHNPDQDQPQV